MTHAHYIVGSCVHEMHALPPASVDLFVTSPPFLGLRDYLDADDPLKVHEHGQAGTPVEFVCELLDTIEAMGHALAPHGSIVVELGDSMAGSGGAGGDYYNADGIRADQPKPPGSAKLDRVRALGAPSLRPPRSTVKGRRRDGVEVPRQSTRSPASPPMRATGPGWPGHKSLAMIPEMLRTALAYGQVPFTDRTTEPWLVRNVVRWCKPNPSVGDEGDKYRRGTNDMLVATKSPDRYWDPLGARGPARTRATNTAPLLDWWEMPTGLFRGAHHATFPLELVAPLIASMCPEKVCTTCGEPRRREVRRTAEYDAARGGGDMYGNADGNDRGTGRNGGYQSTGGAKRTGIVAAEYEHAGWTDCGHGTWRPGMVGDPYAGSGTTLAAAVGAGRDGIGVDADHRNVDLAHQRIGSLFLTVTEGTAHEVPA